MMRTINDASLATRLVNYRYVKAKPGPRLKGYLWYTLCRFKQHGRNPSHVLEQRYYLQKTTFRAVGFARSPKPIKKRRNLP